MLRVAHLLVLLFMLLVVVAQAEPNKYNNNYIRGEIISPAARSIPIKNDGLSSAASASFQAVTKMTGSRPIQQAGPTTGGRRPKESVLYA